MDDPFQRMKSSIEEAYNLSRRAQHHKSRCNAIADRLSFLEGPLKDLEKNLDRSKLKHIYELRDVIDKCVDFIDKYGMGKGVLRKLFSSDDKMDQEFTDIDRNLSRLADTLDLVVVKNLDELSQSAKDGDRKAAKELQLSKERSIECNHWGMKCYISKDFMKAEEYYLEAIRVDPQNSDALNNYGLLLENVHCDYGRAEEFYKRAIAANPRNRDAQYNYNTLAHSVYREYAEASGAYEPPEEPEDVNPLSPVPRQSYPNVPRRVNEKDHEAILDSSTADIVNTSEEANEVAMRYYLQKEYEKAELYYKKAIDMNPKNSDALNNLGLLIENFHKDFKTAEEYYKRSIAANPKNMDALYNYNTLSRSVFRDFVDTSLS